MKTILLIEDNENIRDNTSELLELEGYFVLTAINGRIGLDLAKEMKPDMILCDILMPEANGYEVLRELKRDPRTEGIPFVFISASVEKREVSEAMGMGADGYIRKPFEPEELYKVIDRLLKT